MFQKYWANTQHISGKYSNRQYIKVKKSFQNSKVIGDGVVVGKSPVSHQ